eukprot:361217-Prorocentrum_minimum.AAC.1
MSPESSERSSAHRPCERRAWKGREYSRRGHQSWTGREYSRRGHQSWTGREIRVVRVFAAAAQRFDESLRRVSSTSLATRSAFVRFAFERTRRREYSLSPPRLVPAKRVAQRPSTARGVVDGVNILSPSSIGAPYVNILSPLNLTVAGALLGRTRDCRLARYCGHPTSCQSHHPNYCFPPRPPPRRLPRLHGRAYALQVCAVEGQCCFKRARRRTERGSKVTGKAKGCRTQAAAVWLRRSFASIEPGGKQVQT